MEFGKKFEKSKKMKNENSQKQISSFFIKNIMMEFYGSKSEEENN